MKVAGCQLPAVIPAKAGIRSESCGLTKSELAKTRFANLYKVFGNTCYPSAHAQFRAGARAREFSNTFHGASGY